MCEPATKVGQSGNTVRLRFNAPAAGTYFIAIGFDPRSLIGEPAPGPATTLHYEFTTTGVPDSTSDLDLIKHKPVPDPKVEKPVASWAS